jgi:ribosome recycling factor
MAEDHKVGVRDARRDSMSMLKDLESEGGIGKDDRRRADTQVQDLTDSFTAKIDEVAAGKEKEVLEV